MTDIKTLKALAEAAPTGPWYPPDETSHKGMVFDCDLGSLLRYESIDTERDACVQYVAAANPAAVLDLIESEEEATALCDKLSGLLCEVALAVRGPYEPLRRHGFADLPSRVKAVVSEHDQLKTENTDLHATLQAAKGEIERIKGENEELQESVRLSDLIIAERNRLLDMFDCPMHGQCVPHAMDEVLSLRKDAERYRWLRDKSESIHQFYMSTPIWFTGVKFNKENVDNTIDAAMSKESSHG